MNILLNLRSYDPAQMEKGKRALEKAEKAICVTLGNPLLRHSDPTDYDHLGIVKALRELCFYAREKGREVWVVPCNDYTITSGLFRLSEAVDCREMKYAWNILRTVEMGQTPISALRSMGKRIAHVFLEDGTPSADPDRIAYDHCSLGQGSAQLAETVRSLLEAGYQGGFSAPKDEPAALAAFLSGIPKERIVTDPGQQLAYPMPEFLPPEGHPRVYFRAADIPQITDNMAKPQNERAFALYTQLVNATADPAGEAFDGRLLGIAEAKALHYALHADREKGREAIAIMRNICTAAAPHKWDYNRNGVTIYLLAVVYDWCYPLLDGETRQFFCDAVLRHARHLEIGWPPTRQGSVTGHGPEGQLLRDLMAAGIAMFDEFPNIYQNTAGRFFREFIEPRKFVYQMHCFHQGNEYAAYRMKWELLCTWMFDRMGYPRIFGQAQHETLRHYLYVHRPDGVMLANCNCNNRNNLIGRFDPQLARTLFLGANYWKDEQLKGAAERMLEEYPVSVMESNQTITPVEYLLFNDPELESEGRETLPWVHFQPAPKGGMLIRTGWQDGIDSPDVLCELKIHEYWFAGHSHLDAGAFQIYYKGLLASDDGYYQSWMEERFGDRENSGYTGYGSLHHYNYLRRTVAHNCMLVYDPREQFRDDAFKVHANDGGQRIPNRGNEPPTLEYLLEEANGYRTGHLLGYGWSEDYAYLKGDLTKAYSKKVVGYERSFLFLRFCNGQTPAALLVFDRVAASDPSFKKTWLCHGLFEPKLQGSRSVFTDTRTVPGTGPYSGRYNGRLTVDTLLPKEAGITAVGGPGKEALVDGVNYFGKVGPGQRQEGHGWRLEVSPQSEREEDLFLHVLQLGDADGPEALPVRRIETDTHVGAVVFDRMTLFGKGRDRSNQPVRFVADGEYTVLVADLAPGTWEILCNSTPAQQTEVDGQDGLAVFSCTAGTYEIRRIQ